MGTTGNENPPDNLRLKAVIDQSRSGSMTWHIEDKTGMVTSSYDERTITHLGSGTANEAQKMSVGQRIWFGTDKYLVRDT